MTHPTNSLNPDIYTADGALDMRVVEDKARHLRAQATREMFLAIAGFFKAKSVVGQGAQKA